LGSTTQFLPSETITWEVARWRLKSFLQARKHELRRYAERNVGTTHEYVKQLSHAKDFQEMIRIQTEFMQSLMGAFGDQTKSLTEAYTKMTADTLKKPLTGIS
jgi:hypothetical protein